MKRIASIITTLVVTMVLIFSFAACKEIESGSRIQRVSFDIEFYDGEKSTDTVTVTAKLYLDIAPETTKQIIDLIESKYYDGLCVSNVSSSYAQFGDYAFDGNTLVRKDAEVKTVKGEFLQGGWQTDSKLAVTDGALVLKRGKGFDSGKATIAACFSSSAFNSEFYCVFGKFLTDDGNSDADSSSLERLSSVGKMAKIADLVSGEDGRKVYYFEKDENDNSFAGEYFTYDTFETEANYYRGFFTEDEIKSGEHVDAQLTDEEVTELNKRINSTDGKVECFVLPVNKVIIKKAYLVK